MVLVCHVILQNFVLKVCITSWMVFGVYGWLYGGWWCLVALSIVVVYTYFSDWRAKYHMLSWTCHCYLSTKHMARKHMTCYVQYWSNTPIASINEIQEFLFSVRPNVLTRRYANIKVVNEILCKTGFEMFKINFEIFLTFFEDIENTRIKHTVKHTFKNFIA